MLKNDVDNDRLYNKLNWAYQIKEILDNCGFSYTWHNQFNMLIDYNSIKQRIIDIYCQTWYTSINNSARLDTYCIFKHEFAYESYLDFIKEHKFRTALTQFRISSHHLEIETGRYQNVDRNERICKNCNAGLIENEYHFMLICKKYSDLREKYIKKYYYTWPNIQKFRNLMSVKSSKIIRNLAKYIYFSMRRRT
jgi:hypothetical protein